MRRSYPWSAFAFILTLAISSSNAADWPMYRADPARSGYTSDPLPQDLELRWVYRSQTAPTPAWPSSSRITFDFAYQPIIVGDAVIFGSSSDDKVIAIDAATGELRWDFFTGGPVRFAPAAWQDRLYVASDDGHLYAIKRDDGSLLWKHRGGPNDRMCFGNDRMISRWPARGGPVVMGDTVYYAAGIWPSEGVYLHALNAQTGEVLWTNDSAGSLYLPQPHGGANAHSGVPPQGYLLATKERLFVPTGRGVPAAFRRADGTLEYYRLQQNGSIGGSRAMVSDRFVVNGGCFLERATGNLGARAGRGVFSVSSDGILRSTGATLLAYRWADMEAPDRKGEAVRYRGLEEYCEIEFEDDSAEQDRAEKVVAKVPSIGDLYRTKIRFREAYENIARQTGLERTLSQARPDVEALGYEVDPFLATSYEHEYEVIAADSEAVCGGPGIVRVVDVGDGKVRWSHEVEGAALGLAAANGLLVVSTSKGVVYGFGASTGVVAPLKTNAPTTKPLVAQSNEVDYAKAAEEIIEKIGVTTGICLDLGCGNGELALELVRRSQLRVIGIESDAKQVDRARRMLNEAGLYGTRVSIHHGDPARPPFPRFCANLIVSARSLLGETEELNDVEISRLQRPYGGVVCIGKPEAGRIQRRGPLDGAGNWTHQNCSPANTICSSDSVRGPLELSWYRDGVLEIVDRHAQGPAPLFNQGCLVVQGTHGICALDAYNGHTLWKHPIEGILADWDGVHHDVGVGDTGSNFCLSDQAVFVRTDDRCLKIELQTGEKVLERKTPVDPSAKDRAWGYVAHADGLLFGSVLNDAHTVSPRYDKIRLRSESVLFFAMGAGTGQLKWKYKPEHSIRNNAIAIADGCVYLIDRPLAPADRIDAPTPNGKHRPPLRPGEHPGGTLIAMDAETGSVLWENDDGIFGTQIAVSEEQGVLLMYYQAVKHGFFKLPSEIGGRMAAFDAKTGSRLWHINVEFKTRPLINGDVIYAEGGAWKLKTGEAVPWKFERSYGCGQIAASRHLMLFRSATLGYLDSTRNVGTENFGGIRPSCWFSAIPAGGMVLVPDGSSKCACSYQTRAWLALQQQE